MKVNHNKCPSSIQIGVINSTESEKLLIVHFDNNLKFDTHINKICQKASGKLNALARSTSYMPSTHYSLV